MGLFEVTVRVANPADPRRYEAVSLLVDTGATLCWIPREVLVRLGVAPVSRLTFQLADGRKVEREVAGVLMGLDGRTLPIPVAFSEAGEGAVLGATALEALGFAVDLVEKKLMPRDLLAMVAVRYVDAYAGQTQEERRERFVQLLAKVEAGK